MDRRAFLGTLTGGLLAAPLPAQAQQAGQRPRIGYLASGGPPRHSTEVFIGRLRELGYQQGRNLEFEFRSPRDAGNVEQLRELAAGLVSLRVDILVAAGPPAAEAAQRATRSIPIPVVIVAVDDPVGRGLITSLARPGGNVTGSTWDVSVETCARHSPMWRIPVTGRPQVSIGRASGVQDLIRGRSLRKEASMVLSWMAVSWTVARQLIVGVALMALALVGIEVALFLVAVAFLY